MKKFSEKFGEQLTRFTEKCKKILEKVNADILENRTKEGRNMNPAPTTKRKQKIYKIMRKKRGMESK